MTSRSGLDTASLLSACDLCGCLVVASSLRARTYFAANRAGILRRATQVVCDDVAACCARAVDPERWALLGGTVPTGCEPQEGAALLTCHLCQGPGTADELSIDRVQDEDGWWEMVVCVDQTACEERQRIGPGLPELSG